MEENPRAVIGANNPPTEPQEIEDARSAVKHLKAWLQENPVITTEDEYRAANDQRAIFVKSQKALDEARERETKPIHEMWKAKIAYFKKPQDVMASVLEILVKQRMEPFAKAERERKLREAEEKRRAAEEAERIAREKEAAEQRAIEDAAVGSCEDVAGATLQADAAFDEFAYAARQAARAEKDATKGVRSRFADKATNLRTREILTLQSAHNVLVDVLATDGVLPDGLREAFLSAARAFRTKHGRLPNGVERTAEQVL
jgi:hypothetical protein